MKTRKLKEKDRVLFEALRADEVCARDKLDELLDRLRRTTI